MDMIFLVLVLMNSHGVVQKYTPLVKFADVESCEEALQPALTAALVSLDPEALELVRSGQVRLKTACVRGSTD